MAKKNKLHIKGYILQLLYMHRDGLWDYEITDRVLDEYGYHGIYWQGEIRATLIDLFSGALLEEVEERLDDGTYFCHGKVLIKFKLTRFGKRRMLDADLIPANSS